VREALDGLLRAARSPLVWSVGGFLFLWNFNPFSSTVQQLYMTETLGWSEQFYGNLLAVQSVGQVAACLSYGFYCRRAPFRWLLHASVLLGVLSTVAYWGMVGQTSAVVVTLAVGFSYMTGTLIQLDLAARVCPTQSAGTMFALLMAISNTGLSFGTLAGGQVYDGLAAWSGSRDVAFDVLVGVGAGCTALCWAVVPWLRRVE
jgi:predicted MFS family arabinose efflux permease